MECRDIWLRTISTHSREAYTVEQLKTSRVELGAFRAQLIAEATSQHGVGGSYVVPQQHTEASTIHILEQSKFSAFRTCRNPWEVVSSVAGYPALLPITSYYSYRKVLAEPLEYPSHQ